MEDERRHSNGWQRLTDVAIHDHALDRLPRLPDWRWHACVGRTKPGTPGRPRRSAHTQQVGAGRTPASPSPLHLGQPGPPVPVAAGPRVIGGSAAADRWVVEHLTRRSFRVGRHEQDREPSSLVRREECRSVHAGVVHHGADVVHPGLEGRHLAETVGEAHAPLVEQQHSGECGEALDVLHEQWLIPDGRQVGEAAADDDEIDRAVAEGLVRDAHIAASGISDLGHVHARILGSGRRRRDSVRRRVAGA